MTKEKGVGGKGTLLISSLAKSNLVLYTWQKPLNPSGMESLTWTALQRSSLLSLKIFFLFWFRHWIVYLRIYGSNFCTVHYSFLIHKNILCSTDQNHPWKVSCSARGTDCRAHPAAQRPHEISPGCARPQSGSVVLALTMAPSVPTVLAPVFCSQKHFLFY